MWLGRSKKRSLLLGLPLELREYIYELAFTSDGAFTNLFNAQPPRSALLQTCRSIHSEAKSIFSDSYRRYWESTRFYVDVTGNRSLINDLDRLSDRAISLLTNVEVYGDLKNNAPVWKLKDRIWTMVGTRNVSAFTYLIIDEEAAQGNFNWHPFLSPIDGKQMGILDLTDMDAADAIRTQQRHGTPRMTRLELRSLVLLRASQHSPRTGRCRAYCTAVHQYMTGN